MSPENRYFNELDFCCLATSVYCATSLVIAYVAEWNADASRASYSGSSPDVGLQNIYPMMKDCKRNTDECYEDY